MFNYEWAANKIKLDRAVKYLKDNNLPLTEESIKHEYIHRVGGHVLELPQEVPTEVVPEVQAISLPTARRGRPRKNQ